MQQLKLFTGHTALSVQAALKKRSRNSKNRPQTTPHWDLWTQELEREKEMALFFLDIRNFTPITEQHQASDVIHLVKTLFSHFRKIITAHHGRIIETSGDGFYAAFGFDTTIEEAANEAVKAGKRILENLETLNERSFRTTLKREIEIGIGLHAGKVAMGSLKLGPDEHTLIMGHSVNVAARIEASTRQLNNNFIVSGRVFELLSDRPTESTVTEMNLKGISTPYRLHLIGKSYSH